MNVETNEFALQQYMSPSAHMILRSIQKIEAGDDLTFFQGEAELEQVRMMASTFRGSLYSAMQDRLRRLFGHAGDVVVTQKDLLALIQEVWTRNVARFSDSELAVLHAVVDSPSAMLNEIAESTSLSYAQVRRAYRHLTKTQILRIEGHLNPDVMALERILIILENPTLVLCSPYVEKTLFVEGPSSFAFLVVSCPRNHLDELVTLVRSLRSTSESATLWRLSSGTLHFSDTYFDRRSGDWKIDHLHQRLLLRDDRDPIAVGDLPESSTSIVRFTNAEAKLIDVLRSNYNASVLELVEKTGLSESTVFKRRTALTRDYPVILPRARVMIPQLSERLMVLVSPDSAPVVRHAWSLLPFTYSSRIFNVEDPSQSRIIMITALPPGSGQKMVKITRDETSALDELQVHIVSAGRDQHMSVAAMFNPQTKTWRWDQGDYLDVRGYAIVRREADSFTIPVDLAT